MLLLRLRKETAHLHRRVEAAVELKSHLASHPAYASLLRRSLGFYAPLEDAIPRNAFDCVGLNLSARLKSPLLKVDLGAFGATPGEIASLPRCAQLPSLWSTASTLGCLYVMEGATLGGQIISRQLASALGIDASNGGAFFASYGPNVRAMWSAFGEAAERYCDTAAKQSEALQSAVETFECFEAWFSTPDLPRTASHLTPAERQPAF